MLSKVLVVLAVLIGLVVPASAQADGLRGATDPVPRDPVRHLLNHPTVGFADSTIRCSGPAGYATDCDLKRSWDYIETHCLNDAGTGFVDIRSSDLWTAEWWSEAGHSRLLRYVLWKANGDWLMRGYYAYYDSGSTSASTYHDITERASEFCSRGP